MSHSKVYDKPARLIYSTEQNTGPSFITVVFGIEEVRGVKAFIDEARDLSRNR